MSTGAARTEVARNEGFFQGSWQGWPLERALFALAGTTTGLSAVLSALVSPWFLLLTGFISLNLLLFAGAGNCGASLILRHGFGLQGSCDRRGADPGQDAGR
jgi:hypothetical protein